MSVELGFVSRPLPEGLRAMWPLLFFSADLPDDRYDFALGVSLIRHKEAIDASEPCRCCSLSHVHNGVQGAPLEVEWWLNTDAFADASYLPPLGGYKEWTEKHQLLSAGWDQPLDEAEEVSRDAALDFIRGYGGGDFSGYLRREFAETFVNALHIVGATDVEVQARGNIDFDALLAKLRTGLDWDDEVSPVMFATESESGPQFLRNEPNDRVSPPCPRECLACEGFDWRDHTRELTEDDLVRLREVWEGLAVLNGLEAWKKKLSSEKFFRNLDESAGRWLERKGMAQEDDALRRWRMKAEFQVFARQREESPAKKLIRALLLLSNKHVSISGWWWALEVIFQTRRERIDKDKKPTLVERVAGFLIRKDRNRERFPKLCDHLHQARLLRGRRVHPGETRKDDSRIMNDAIEDGRTICFEILSDTELCHKFAAPDETALEKLFLKWEKGW